MTINLQIKHICDYCGHTAEFSGDIQPDDLECTLWYFQLDNDPGCMAVDSRLPGKVFCSDKCRDVALAKVGLKPSMEPVFA